MILNERMYKITKAQAQKFRVAIAAAMAEGPPHGTHPKMHRGVIAGMQHQLKDLDADLEAYERLKSAAGKKRLSESIDQLGLLLIQARIARGLTQKQLGERLGLHMQKIQEYESTGYARASATRIREVLTALGAQTTIDVRLVPLPALEEFAAPVKS